MKIVNFGEKYNTPLALALGFFDCIHKGHATLVNAASEFASSCGERTECGVFTFSNDPSDVLAGKPQIYGISERSDALEDIGAEVLISAKFTREFAETPPEEFLDELFSTLDIRAVFVGADYTFGKDGMGDVELLRRYADECGARLCVVPFTLDAGQKLSTRMLRSMVEHGKVGELNRQLSQPYFMKGRVVRGRRVGGEIGFPTANIAQFDKKLPLADGIYATRILVDGRAMDSMTNIGGKPTFGVSESTVETYIFDFDGDLYGKTVKLSFYDRTRDVQNFRTPEALADRLKRDEIQIRALFEALNERQI